MEALTQRIATLEATVSKFGEAEANDKKKKKPKDPNRPKKPLSPYLVFCQKMRKDKKFMEEHAGLKMTELQGVIAKEWKKHKDSEADKADKADKKD